MALLGLMLYALLLLAMVVYGLNTALLVGLHALRDGRTPAPALPAELPIVTVQLPVYNEANVVERVLRAAAALDWPADKLQIQLLDDSTDATPELAAPVVAELRAQGIDVQHLRRVDRVGYKAGALAAGMLAARGSLFAIFDADFVPAPGFLRQAVGRFADPTVAAVQGRWTHLNRDWSGLTQAQALAIDSHFGVEQGARMAAGWFLNFNGSGGIWRGAAIQAAGGWSGDTLTEDLDLSYRVQLAGWRILYDPDLHCPSELPIDLAAFKTQQRRWATGSMQVARKLLPSVWRSKARLDQKLQASLHLTHYAVHVLIFLTALLSVPCVLLPGAGAEARGWWSLALPFLVAMSGPSLLHIYAQRVLEGRWVRPRELGLLTLFGIGIAASNAVAVLAAFRGSAGEFVRTPKHGVRSHGDPIHSRYRAGQDNLLLVEALLAAYCLLSALLLAWFGVYEITPFMALDAMAFALVAAQGLRETQAWSGS